MSDENQKMLSASYENGDYGFSLRHPPDWEVIFEDESEGMWMKPVCMAEPPDPSGRAGFTLQVGPLSEGGTVKSYLEKAESDLSGMFSDFSLIRAEEREVLGWPAAWMEYRYSGGVGDMQELNVTVFLGKTRTVPLQFICESPKTKYSRWFPAFEQIINSLEIMPKGLSLPQVVLVGGQNCGRCGRSLSDSEDVGAVMDPEAGDVVPVCAACRGSSPAQDESGQELDQADVDAGQGDGSKCFVATVCYETADAPQVNLLRTFRDDCLMRSRIGSALVRLYCWVSPPIADALSRRPTARRLVKRLLVDPIVRVVRSTR